MITIRNEHEFNEEFEADLQDVIDWINKNLQVVDVFDKEKIELCQSTTIKN